MGALTNGYRALTINGISYSLAQDTHLHTTSDITSGIFNIARIPTGTSGTTVALGNHTHSQYLTAITKAQVEGVLTGNITTHTHSYLPLTGGTLTGNLNGTNILVNDVVSTQYRFNATTWSIVGDSNNLYFKNLFDTPLTISSTGNVTAPTFIGALSGNASSATNLSRSILAGNGLTGGALSADRTLTLGTPSDITATSANSVTATSHTHNLSMGSGSGLDADLLDGYDSSQTSLASTVAVRDGYSSIRVSGVRYTERSTTISTAGWYRIFYF